MLAQDPQRSAIDEIEGSIQGSAGCIHVISQLFRPNCGNACVRWHCAWTRTEGHRPAHECTRVSGAKGVRRMRFLASSSRLGAQAHYVTGVVSCSKLDNQLSTKPRTRLRYLLLYVVVT